MKYVYGGEEHKVDIIKKIENAKIADYIDFVDAFGMIVNVEKALDETAKEKTHIVVYDERKEKVSVDITDNEYYVKIPESAISFDANEREYIVSNFSHAR